MSGRSKGGGGDSGNSSQRSGLHETPNGEERIMLPGADSKERLYEQRRDKKTFRVVTVMVYVLCVSMAAIILSLYYVFFWEPKGPHYTKVVFVTPIDTATVTPCFTHARSTSGSVALDNSPTPTQETSTSDFAYNMFESNVTADQPNNTLTTTAQPKIPRKKRRRDHPNILTFLT